MRFVEDEFLLATRVCGPPDTQERLAEALAISEARRARATRRHLRVVKPAGARVVFVAFGRPAGSRTGPAGDYAASHRGRRRGTQHGPATPPPST